MFRFNFCQKFYLDPSAVENATEISFTRVDLYFRAKPPADNNKSGIYKPGVELMMIPVEGTIPVINQIGAYRPTEPTEHGAKFAFYSGGEIARVEYDDIQASTDASILTQFLLETPAIVKTGREYAFVVKFDGDENFVLWQNVIGEFLVNSDTFSTQHSRGFQGTLYSWVDNPLGSAANGYGYTTQNTVSSTANNAALIGTSQQDLDGSEFWELQYLQSNWNEIPNAALKFHIHVARYYHKGFSVLANTAWQSNAFQTSAVNRVTYVHSRPNNHISNNITRLSTMGEPLEYIIFNRSKTDKRSTWYGEPLYMDNTPSWPGGTATPLTINCYANTTGNNHYNSTYAIANGAYLLANGDTFANIGGWNSFLTQGDVLTITTANGTHRAVKLIREIINNTEIRFAEPFETTWLNATFKVTPVGFVSSIAPSYAFGKVQDLVQLHDPLVNTGTRFVTAAINAISINASGTGYSNSDYIRISGYEDIYQNHRAFANIVTDASGNITAIYVSNCGAGFTNTDLVTGANIEILQSSNGTPSNTVSTGNSAVFDISIGTNLRSSFTNTVLRECEVVNLPTHRIKPEITVNNPVGAAFTITHRSLFHGISNSSAIGGYSYYINTPTESDETNTFVKIFKGHTLLTSADKFPVFPSRSNQLVMSYANGYSPPTSGNNSIWDIVGTGWSNAMTLHFDISSNSDFQAIYVDPEIVYTHYSMYIINRDYTNEHTNFGNAWARQIQKKVTFQEDRTAEDCLVYLTAHRPIGTELLVYGKFLNSADPEEFDDRNWTLLEQVDGVGVYSSFQDSSDFVEYTYNFPQYPNSEFTLDGTVEVWQGNAYVNGTATILQAQFVIDDAGTGYSNGDLIYAAPTAQTVPSTGIYATHPVFNAKGTITTDASGNISSIAVSNGGFGWANQSQTDNTVISFTNATGGATGGSGANVVFQPGLAANDLIKIYSPLFPNTNYTLQVVNSFVSNTSMTIVRTFGEIGANLVGTVSVNATSNAVTGTSTLFLSDFSVGDFVAVWANSSVYETRQVSTITNDTTMTVDSNWTIANSSTTYAYVTPHNFMNNSISVDELKIDRIAAPYEHSVYNDFLFANVATYFNNDMAQFKGYSTFQIKVVMLSNNNIVTPKIDDVRGVGVTA